MTDGDDLFRDIDRDVIGAFIARALDLLEDVDLSSDIDGRMERVRALLLLAVHRCGGGYRYHAEAVTMLAQFKRGEKES